jgi:hypothetical protein
VDGRILEQAGSVIMQYSEIGKIWTKLSLISGRAQRDHTFKFTSLAHLLDVEYLRDCYQSLNRNIWEILIVQVEFGKIISIERVE